MVLETGENVIVVAGGRWVDSSAHSTVEIIKFSKGQDLTSVQVNIRSPFFYAFQSINQLSLLFIGKTKFTVYMNKSNTIRSSVSVGNHV